eukprot:5216635-Pyramimonas_sp.AAC.1
MRTTNLSTHLSACLLFAGSSNQMRYKQRRSRMVVITIGTPHRDPTSHRDRLLPIRCAISSVVVVDVVVVV